VSAAAWRRKKGVPLSGRSTLEVGVAGDGESEALVALSIVVPVYNSEALLPEVVRRSSAVARELVGEKFELVFVNDGSVDGSWATLEELAVQDPHVVAIDLSRNYGQHNALMCGFSKARGEFLATIDDDLQTPPEEIPKLYQAMVDDVDVVYGVYAKKQHDIFRNVGSWLVQKVYGQVFGLRGQLSSFRLLRRRIAHAILAYNLSFTFIDGLLAWYTTRIVHVEVAHHERKTGRSGYSLRGLVLLAFNMLTNFSTVPLHLATAMGLLFSLMGFGAGAFFLIKKLVWSIPVEGYTSMIVAIAIFAGVQLLTLGILGEYIGRMHINVNRRPQFDVRRVRPSSRR